MAALFASFGVLKPSVAQNQAHFGTINSLNNSSFNLDIETKNGPTNFAVNLDSNTAFKKDGAIDKSVDLAVGQQVVVRGLTDLSDNTIVPQSVNIITHRGTQSGLKHVFNKQK